MTDPPKDGYSAQMPVFLVTELRDGPAWDPALPLREQSGFAEHAAFMDALVAEGVMVLGGPLADERPGRRSRTGAGGAGHPAAPDPPRRRSRGTPRSGCFDPPRGSARSRSTR